MMSRSLLRWFSPAEGSTSEDSHEIDSLNSTTATSYSPVSTNPSSNSLESLSLSSVAADEQQEPESVSESCCLDDQTSSQKALKGSSDACTASLLPESPNQPVLSFPMRTFGSQQRAFRASWYSKYSWLHYQESSDSVLCFYCCVAERRGLLIAGSKDDAFTKLGFSNWKKALLKFEKHHNSVCHKKAVECVINIPKTHADVGEMLSLTHAHQKAVNRQMLKIILSSIRYLARQGLALRGRYKTASENADKRGELDSNLLQLLKTRSEDNPELKTWLQKSQDKFTSPDIQNEILSLMALRIVRDIASELSGRWFTVMVDETTDLSNTEQLVFCIRYVDDCLNVHEEPVGFYCLESTSADSIMTTIQDILLRMNLNIHNCRGQCYDGASNMAGAKSGVSTKIRQLESRALYTHCYGHALNLATQDALKGSKCMEAALDTVHEITKLIKKSPKREVIFKQTKSYVTPGSPGIRILCPTRWTVRAEALTSISENYKVLQSTWYEARSATKDTETRSRIIGVDAQMERFDFYFGVELGRKLLNMVGLFS